MSVCAKIDKAVAECVVPLHSDVVVAVSGGADSVCLLLSLVNLQLAGRYSFTIHVVTVNHNIRSPAESGGDASFVESLSNNLRVRGANITFVERVLEPGEVALLSQSRKCGIEDAARVLRYGELVASACEYGVHYILVAHNLNDNIETIIMRFLQGGQSKGIDGERKLHPDDGGAVAVLRPLLNITRAEIEQYLAFYHQDFRTDMTNFDEHYMRNKIRGSLVPLLRTAFPGYENALLMGNKICSMDADYFDGECAKVLPLSKTKECVQYNRQSFEALHVAISSRVVFGAISAVGSHSRVPRKVVLKIIDDMKSGLKKGRVVVADIEIGFDSGVFYCKLCR